MTRPAARCLTTPKGAPPCLRLVRSPSGLAAGILPNACLFALEHADAQGRIMISQVEGSPLAGGIFRLYLRRGGSEKKIAQAVGPGARVRFGIGADRGVWVGEALGIRHSTTLWLHARDTGVALAGRGLQRRDEAVPGTFPGPGPGSRTARLPDGQRGLRFAISRPPCRAHPAFRPGRDDPAEFGPGRPQSLGRAADASTAPRPRDRCDAVFGPAFRDGRRSSRRRSRVSGCSTRSPVRC